MMPGSVWGDDAWDPDAWDLEAWAAAEEDALVSDYVIPLPGQSEVVIPLPGNL